MKDDRPYRVVGAFDTETTNLPSASGATTAFTALYQVGEIACELKEVKPDNVRDLVSVRMHRDDEAAFAHLLGIANRWKESCIPVVCVHNLGFDMHALAGRLVGFSQNASVRVLAKTPQKPLTIALESSGKAQLVLWDTLNFSHMSLEKMGLAAGFEKGTGEWDYTRIRAPKTKLDDDESDYAVRDIYALFAWLGWWVRRNDLIDESDLARFAITKTGVVRVKRRRLFEDLRARGKRRTVGELWHALNDSQVPKDDDELFSMQACTRGGFTFCASEHAGREFHDVLAFDAKSQHPAQMVSHLYPVDFKRASERLIAADAELVGMVTRDDLLSSWDRAFPVAFYACFEFVNLRPKPGSLYARNGIYPLAFARVKGGRREGRDEHADEMRRLVGYADDAPDGCEHAFGKVVSAPNIRLWLTELGFWEVMQAYDFDHVFPVIGWESARFVKPSDMSVLSVMEFYRLKNNIKEVRSAWYGGNLHSAIEVAKTCLPEYLLYEMQDGIDVSDDLEFFYMSAKADLNALFGIEATNEARRDMELTDAGIEYAGSEGLANMPKHSKAWYQFGQRIVGWSRIAQHVVMSFADEAGFAIINGDTDSIKCAGGDRAKLDEGLTKFARSIDRAKTRVMARVRNGFPDRFDPLEGIGRYELEAVYPQFYSAWNKCYAVRKDGRYFVTMAGIPADKRGDFGSLEDFMLDLEKQGMSFQQVCGCALGYNCTISPDITKLRMRTIPKFASRFRGRVTDWRGDAIDVDAPAAIGLSPMAKVVGGFQNDENRVNALLTAKNNSDLMIKPHLLYWEGDKACILT